MSIPRILLLSALIVATGCAHSAVTPPAAEPDAAPPDDAFRSKPPAPLEGRGTFSPTPPTERRLKNGLRVLVVENHTLPLVAAELLVPAGFDKVPLNKTGLAEMVCRALLEGTTTKTSAVVSLAREDLGMELTASPTFDGVRIHMHSIKDVWPKALALFGEAVMEPGFRKDDVERVRRQMLTALNSKKGNSSQIAYDVVLQRIFGAQHPWGQPLGGNPRAVEGLRAEELKAFHQAWFTPDSATLVIAGDVTADEVVTELEQQLGRWKSRPMPKVAPLAQPLPARAELTLVDIPSATQSQIWMMAPLFPASHPDLVAVEIAHRALGGMFSSRLNMELRERRGLSYGVRSSIAPLNQAGFFYVSGGFDARKTVEAVTGLQDELKRFLAVPLSEAELQSAKESYLQWLPGQMGTNDETASAYVTLVMRGLPLDFWTKLSDRIRAVTKEDVARVSETWLRADAWPVVVVGPTQQSKTELTPKFSSVSSPALEQVLGFTAPSKK